MLTDLFPATHYVTAFVSFPHLPFSPMEISYIGPDSWTAAETLMKLIHPNARVSHIEVIPLKEYRDGFQSNQNDTVCEVLKTDHQFIASQYVYILVDGKRVGVPPQFNAQPGDQIIHRKRRQIEPAPDETVQA